MYCTKNAARFSPERRQRNEDGKCYPRFCGKKKVAHGGLKIKERQPEADGQNREVQNGRE